MSLKGPKTKMSKSDPSSAIFMDDSTEEIQEKIKKAFCNDEVEGNPIFEYIQYLLLPWRKTLELCGNEYHSLEEIRADFPAMDKLQLKGEVAKYIDEIVGRVRAYFEKPQLRELIEQVRSFRVTR